MARAPLFAGLVFDENDQPAETAYVGEEPCYVVNDAGFLRHIPSAQVDTQVLEYMKEMIQGSEGLLAEQAAKMLGQDDIFSRAMLESQLKNIENQFDQVLDAGIPEEGRAYLGMTGFRITIDVHGEVININQPGITSEGDE